MRSIIFQPNQFYIQILTHTTQHMRKNILNHYQEQCINKIFADYTQKCEQIQQNHTPFSHTDIQRLFKTFMSNLQEKLIKQRKIVQKHEKRSKSNEKSYSKELYKKEYIKEQTVKKCLNSKTNQTKQALRNQRSQNMGNPNMLMRRLNQKFEEQIKTPYELFREQWDGKTSDESRMDAEQLRFLELLQQDSTIKNGFTSHQSQIQVVEQEENLHHLKTQKKRSSQSSNVFSNSLSIVQIAMKNNSLWNAPKKEKKFRNINKFHFDSDQSEKQDYHRKENVKAMELRGQKEQATVC